MKIISVVGARPNFMKIAPLCREFRRHPEIDHVLVHTGQHYDVAMSEAFFTELDIPSPDVSLGIGSGSHAEQLGKTMIEFEKVVRAENPDWIVVVGDVNATCAASIVAKKEHVLLAHVEAGLRSRDMDMPEEVNRLVTDRLADLLLVPDRISAENLRREGVPQKNIVFAGNIMIDTLEKERARAAALDLHEIVSRNLAGKRDLPPLADEHFSVVTLHRPSNVDHEKKLKALVDFLIDEAASTMPLLWTIHPRTKKQLIACDLWEKVSRGAILLDPLGYHDMLRLNMGAKLMLTDSGGLQEECCVLGTPCLTMRDNTERPVTLRENGGVSILVGNDVAKIRKSYREMLDAPRQDFRPELWDGATARRIVEAILHFQP